MDRLARLIAFCVAWTLSSCAFAGAALYPALTEQGSPDFPDIASAINYVCSWSTKTLDSCTVTDHGMFGGDRLVQVRSTAHGPNEAVGSSSWVTGYRVSCSSGTANVQGFCSGDPCPTKGSGWTCGASTQCPPSGDVVAPSGTVYEAGNGLTSVVCLAGCEASAFMAAKQDGKNYVWGPIVSAGRACSGSSAPAAAPADPTCPVGKCPGTINGQSICVPCSETKQDTKASSSETAASAASGAAPGPGQTTTQSGSSSTTCAGDTCTTTGQQTVQNPDGSSETKTTTTTQSKGDYCKENPKAGACVGSESTWGGTCQAFTCDGDAVQCAQARGAWELACQLKTEATDPTVQAGTDAISQTGEASIKDQLGMNTSQVFDLASRLDSTSLFGTPGACPSDTVLPLGIGSVTLPFASMCPQLNLVGVAMMGLAYLIAAFIVFRPGKGA